VGTDVQHTAFKLRSALAALAVAATAALAAPQAAYASVPKSWCDGKSYKKVVKNYHRGAGSYPLRCGNARWGFLHITHRWNAAFDSSIALTIAKGEEVKDLQQDGGSAIFALFDNRCHELFRVIYNGGALHGNGIRPQGIITAYYRTGSTSAEERMSPSYRKDCGVIQQI
jgi:hypothetical protein